MCHRIHILLAFICFFPSIILVFFVLFVRSQFTCPNIEMHHDLMYSVTHAVTPRYYSIECGTFLGSFFFYLGLCNVNLYAFIRTQLEEKRVVGAKKSV